MPSPPLSLGPRNAAASGRLALEFLNTRGSRGGRSPDPLQAPETFLAWLRERGLGPWAPPSGVSTAEARTLLDEGRRLRTDVEAVVQAHHLGRPLPGLGLFGVNRVLAAARWAWLVEVAPSGPELGVSPAGSGPHSPLVPIAVAAALVITGVPRDRLRACASPRCGAWFIDTSKGGQRRWCSMARCGNREKAATHRAKVARR